VRQGGPTQGRLTARDSVRDALERVHHFVERYTRVDLSCRARTQYRSTFARSSRMRSRSAGAVVVFVEQRVDPILTPQLLRTACIGRRHLLGIAAVVGVHDAMPSTRELGESCRLTRPGHPRHQHHGHDAPP
jgi:hypothetical protein